MQISNLLPGLLRRSLENLSDTDPPVFCKICGAQKQDFISPMEAHRPAGIVVLDCVCERDHQAKIEFYAAYRGCWHVDRNGKKISYATLIDGTLSPQSEDENEIAEIGRATRADIDRVNALLAR